MSTSASDVSRENRRRINDRFMPIHDPELQARGERVLGVEFTAIRLGAGVMVGPKVTFITMGHPVEPRERRQYLTGAPIDVAENAWIGAGATILPGVSIGRDAVIGAGTVVADDVPAASLVAGPKGTVIRRWE